MAAPKYRQSGYHKIDIAIIFPLSEEYRAVLHLLQLPDTSFEFIRDFRPNPAGPIHKLLRHKNGLLIAMSQLEQMGNTFALKHTIDLIEALEPLLVVCVGIAGSLSSDLSLMDVAIADRVVDIANAAKIVDIPDKDTYQVNLVAHPFEPPKELLGLISHFLHDDAQIKRWREACRSDLDRATADLVDDRAKQAILNLADRPVEIAQCNFSCGFVLASERLRTSLPGRQNKIIETEGSGIAQACKDTKSTFLIVRGVSDLADPAKAALESASKGHVRAAAATNAFRALAALLEYTPFLGWLKHAQLQRAGTARSGVFGYCAVPLVGMEKAREELCKFARSLEAEESQGDGYTFLASICEKFWNSLPSAFGGSIPEQEAKLLLYLLTRTVVWFSMKGDKEGVGSILMKKDILFAQHPHLNNDRLAIRWKFSLSHVKLQDGDLMGAISNLSQARQMAARLALKEVEPTKALYEQMGLSAEKCGLCIRSALLPDGDREALAALVDSIGSLRRRTTISLVNDHIARLRTETYFDLILAKAAWSVGDWTAMAERSADASERIRARESAGAGSKDFDVKIDRAVCDLLKASAMERSQSTEQSRRGVYERAQSVGTLGCSKHCFLIVRPELRSDAGLEELNFNL